jgi:hypothetical protein
LCARWPDNLAPRNRSLTQPSPANPIRVVSNGGFAPDAVPRQATGHENGSSTGRHVKRKMAEYFRACGTCVRLCAAAGIYFSRLPAFAPNLLTSARTNAFRGVGVVVIHRFCG